MSRKSDRRGDKRDDRDSRRDDRRRDDHKRKDRDERDHRDDRDKRHKESRHHDDKHRRDREDLDDRDKSRNTGSSSSRDGDSPYESSHRERDEKPRSKSGRLSEFSSAASSPFQRPMDEQERQAKELARRAREKEREKEQEKRYTPIPSPFATHVSSPAPSQAPEPTITPAQLNKMKAKAIRAKMMGLPDADALEKEYEDAQKMIAEAASRPPPEPQRVVVVQTMGRPSSGSASPVYGLRPGPGNSKAQGKPKKEATHDDQGNRVAYQGEEGDLDLQEMLRREKMGLGEDMDQELARRITRDAVFKASFLMLLALQELLIEEAVTEKTDRDFFFL